MEKIISWTIREVDPARMLPGHQVLDMKMADGSVVTQDLTPRELEYVKVLGVLLAADD
ncbi:MAG TPA: hypothetical protein VI876_05315 [Dehalococcoidia bacterium]|nr:hypothetical protein [Dehalococcoidia bacterium]